MINPFTGQSLATLLDAQAARNGERIFLRWAPFDAEPRLWTYARFHEEVARLAGGLLARGVKAGDRVLLHAENCPEFLLGYFACAWMGAVAVAVNPKASGPELEYYAARTSGVGAITQEAFEGLFARHAARLPWVEVAGRLDSMMAEPVPYSRSEPLAPVSLLFTSGTTSRPKAVVWTHANVLWAARAGAAQLGMRANDVFHVCLPLYHVVGLAWSVLPALWAGASVLLQPRFSASRYWPAAMEHRATVASHVQFSSRVLSQNPVPDGHHFRIWGNSSRIAEYEAHFGVRIIGWWGMTELVAPGIIGDLALGQVPGSIGRAAFGYRVWVTDPAGRPVAPGDVGALLIEGARGETLFAGYLDDPQATADAFDAAGRFRTGDRLRLNEDGSLTFVERARDVIKVGGEGVSAAEVERVIRLVGGVNDVAVVGRSDPSYGEVCIAFIVPAGGTDRSQLGAAVVDRCRGELAPFKVPKELRFLSALPRAGLDKVAKGELRALAAMPEGSAPSYGA